MDVSATVGLVSGLIAIFSFLTGVSSIRGLRRSAGSGSSPAAERHRTRQWVVLGLSAPVFLVSMAVTLGRGLMSGDDTGGTRFLLLLLGAVFLWRYAVRWHASVPWPAFLLGCAMVLAALGWLFGTISAGEELEGVQAGLIVGAGVGLCGAVFSGSTAAGPARPVVLEPAGADPSPDQVAREREILALARQCQGNVAVGEVALYASLSLDDARELLNQLAERGFCERRVEIGGAVRYRFPDFAPY